MLETSGVAQQRLGVSKEVMADGHWLSSLEVGVAGHQPVRVFRRLDRECVDQSAEQPNCLPGGVAAEQPEVERDLVVPRAAGMQAGA